MLAYIKGVVAYKDAELAIVEAGGIGYELAMSVHAIASLPAVGSPAQVWTYLQAKEDGIALFGFSEPKEKELFLRLIAVSGIGPRMALSALSTFKPEELVANIAVGDIAAISTISGVGKKTAQRIVLELQGALKADDALPAASGEAASQMRDAASALESMGFTPEEVSAALKGCTETTTSAIVRYALKHVGGAA